ncbi:helix-turn-helix domain-containing protein [Brevibacterium samyangense]|uniref:Resolvase HTH domain-containing protein n=1 Tax=Brevibacterium samyangense TaxID=366888 RepID=A0ABN2TAC3_9MICO
MTSTSTVRPECRKGWVSGSETFRHLSGEPDVAGGPIAATRPEHSCVRELQEEGIALAKAKGVYEKQRSLSDEDIDAARALVEMGVPKTEVARRYGCSRQTLYAALVGKGIYGKPSSSSGAGV